MSGNDLFNSAFRVWERGPNVSCLVQIFPDYAELVSWARTEAGPVHIAINRGTLLTMAKGLTTVTGYYSSGRTQWRVFYSPEAVGDIWNGFWYSEEANGSH